jgi:hypothetical protein
MAERPHLQRRNGVDCTQLPHLTVSKPFRSRGSALVPDQGSRGGADHRCAQPRPDSGEHRIVVHNLHCYIGNKLCQGRSLTRKVDTMDETYEVVVVGGGAAGLSGAVALARSRRSVLVIDADDPRNAPARHVHNFLTRDGTPSRRHLCSWARRGHRVRWSRRTRSGLGGASRR